MPALKTTAIEAPKLPNYASLCAAKAERDREVIARRDAKRLELEDAERVNFAHAAAALKDSAEAHNAEVEGRIVDAQHALQAQLKTIWASWQVQPTRDLAREFAAKWRAANASRLEMAGVAVREWEAVFPLFDIMLESNPERLQWLTAPDRLHFTSAWSAPVARLHSALVSGADVPHIYDLMTQVESSVLQAASTALHYPAKPESAALWDAIRFGGSSRAIDSAVNEINKRVAATVRRPAPAPAEFVGYGGSTFRTKTITTGEELDIHNL